MRKRRRNFDFFFLK
ncbi:hypothetical protein DPX39_010035300 [Trypanosoma brucei equiperdum]|uniref:Uncharacterized protein n=1 Tax=Trypanosoma brucei equiperdum TaxID=630700 RepID=A0A3L6LIM9_9TRYP|nr:hypothetical protein DPX39_010035300 [Trypanosoma brucei equiperdum]